MMQHMKTGKDLDINMKHLIIFATGNKNKIREIEEIITDPSLSVLSMSEAGVKCDPEEDGTSFEENALIKARAVYDLILKKKAAGDFSPPGFSNAKGQEAPYDITVMSDDSGLEVDALDGAPGIYSARYLGRDTDYTFKMNHIIDLLKDVPEEKRTARFVAAVAAVYPDGSEHVVRGTMEGQIGYSIAGQNGFGYDPFFFLPEYGMTSAEITPEQKNAISHRGKALRTSLNALQLWRETHANSNHQ